MLLQDGSTSTEERSKHACVSDQESRDMRPEQEMLFAMIKSPGFILVGVLARTGVPESLQFEYECKCKRLCGGIYRNNADRDPTWQACHDGPGRVQYVQ